MWSTQMHPAAFEAIGEISIPEKEGWAGQDKSDDRP